jgi:polyphosphate kinase
MAGKQNKKNSGKDRVENRYTNREASWLSFNERVLQEAADPATPLIERIKFLGIFSSNLDEFYRVRVATLKRILNTDRKSRVLLGEAPDNVLVRIEETVIRLHEKFDDIYSGIVRELGENGIVMVNEHELTSEQNEYVHEYFQENVRPLLFPVLIDNLEKFPVLKDNAIYLAVLLRKKKASKSPDHAIIEVPTNSLSRFLVLPKNDGKTRIILLDDVIRLGMDLIFSMFGYTRYEAFTIKVTRDAELEQDDDITKSFYEKMSKSLRQRKTGAPVRFVYDHRIPSDFLKLLIKKNHLKQDDTLIPGGRYHNFRDFMGFPAVGPPMLRYEPLPPLNHPDLDPRQSIISVMKKKDILLHYPYQTFNHLIDLLREASFDPKVSSIKMTLYRVAKNSSVANALIRAVRNGKSVTVVIELQARFDEEANIYWTDRLREEGVKIIHGVPNLKVHSKLCLITRIEHGREVLYANVATGNYNENTARIYSDHGLLTSDKRITRDVERLFEFFDNNYKSFRYNHLVVSPFSMRARMTALIHQEMKNARNGKPASIILKSNSLFDKGMIDLLYDASRAGVRITLIVRGICSLIPGVPGMSENIDAFSIVDRFLEHSRIYIFHNDGDELYYISSADWMTRNIDRRVEVTCPIYDPSIQRELREFIDIQLRDNQKARYLDEGRENVYRRDSGAEPVRAQPDIYRLLKSKLGQIPASNPGIRTTVDAKHD